MPSQLLGDEDQDARSGASNPGQAHYDRLFRELTSAEHMAKNGKSASQAEQDERNQFTDDSSEDDADSLNNPARESLYRRARDSEVGDSVVAALKAYAFREATSRAIKKIGSMSVRVQLAIVAAIVIGILFILSLLGLSSMQAIHLAQQLALDHTSNIHYTDIRTYGMFRYVKSGDNLGETRVSLLGSEVFKSTVNQLADIGVSIDGNYKLGVFKGVTIDTTKFPETKNLSRDQVKARLASYYRGAGITEADIDIRGNQARINNLGTGVAKALINDTVSRLEGGKTANWVKSRQVLKYWSIPTLFHPFREVDRRITAKIDSHEDLIKARKAQQPTYDSPSRTQAYEDFKAKTSGIRASADGVLLITGAVCIVKGAADEAITYNREAIVVPQAIAAADAMAVGSQQQAGMDIASSQVNIYNRVMTDPDGKSVWDARALKAKTDPTTNQGEDLSPKYAQAFDASTTANSLKNLGGAPMNAACSKGGQAVQIVIGGLLIGLTIPTSSGSAFLYGALKTAGNALAGVVAMVLLHDLIESTMKDEPIPDNLAATERGNLLAYGSREYANINARGSGGVDLGKQESNKIDSEIAQQDRSEFESKPLFARLFDVGDHRSLMAQMVMRFSSPQKEIKSFATGILNVGSTLASTFSGLIPSAQAAAPYDYGFNRFGIPERILNNPAYANPYENSDVKIPLILGSEKGQDYIDRANKCFGVKIERIDGKWGVIPERDVNPLSSEYEDARCNDANDSSWDRIILFVHDSTTAEAIACYGGNQESCKIIGAATQEQVCSLTNGTSVANMPDWVKMPVVNAQAGSAVRSNINVAIANIKYGYNVAPSLRVMVGNDPDFILLNEVAETPLKDMEAAIGGYGAYRDNTTDGDSQVLNNVIMWKKDRWKFVDGGRVKLVDRDMTFAQGEPRTWNRYAAWAVFKNDKGEVVPVIATHMMTNPAKYPRQHGDPPMTRIQQYSLGMDVLKQLIATLSPYGPVLVGGDMNSQDDQGDWSAVPKMKSIGYNYTHDGAVIYGFYPSGTKLVNGRTVPIPIGDDHGGNSVFMRVNMNGAGPGSITGDVSATTSTTNCDDASNGSSTTTPGSATMVDDYKSPQCDNFRSGGAPGLACDGQCVDFVKFRLKKHIDKNKFASLGDGKDVARGLGEDYGYRVDSTPAVNAVASWRAGQFGMNATHGHTAMVSKVNADGSIVVEEYNVIPGTYSTRKIPAEQARQLTYAHTEIDF
ncbi:MAG TPA: CHAP domain-containing protein [Candidatus Saccharimonadales bacterium]